MEFLRLMTRNFRPIFNSEKTFIDFPERGQRNLPAVECNRWRHSGRLQQLPHGRQNHSQVDVLVAQGS